MPVILTVKVDFDLPAPPKREDTLESLHDPDPEIREAALVWLSSYRPVTEQQKAAVESALVDSSPLVQRVAQQALEKLNSLPADDLAAGETGARADVPPTVEPMRVGGQIRKPKRLKYVAPVYPEIAMQVLLQGTVVLDCVISPQGIVTDVKVLHGIPLLDQAAIDTVKKWVYAPTLVNGVPVPVIMTVGVAFHLPRR